MGSANCRRLLAVALVLPLLGQSAQAVDPLGETEPSRTEQHGIYVLNKARNDPTAYGNQIGVDLSAAAPRPALAVNRNLTGSSRFHAKEMLENDYFGHTSEVTGDGPNQMIVQNGYDLFGDGLNQNWGTANNVESIAFGVNSITTYAKALALLIEDKGVPGLGHRVHLLATSTFWAAHREVGFGRAATGGTYYYAIHTANVNAGDTFITGVVYNDKNGNGKYDLDEGVGGVTVEAGAFSEVSMEQGGYSIPVPAGDYAMTASGGGFRGLARADVTVGASNVEVDFRSGLAGAQVDFVDVDLPLVVLPVVGIVASTTLGDAPLDVGFTASSDMAPTMYAWDFGDGGNDNGTMPDHRFEQPGVYPVVLSGTTDDGTGKALEVVAVGGAAGAGEGTTPPASTDLFVKKAKILVKFNKTGKDVVAFNGTIEMPAGFVPGAHSVVVCLAGARLAFTLTEKNKAVDANKNKVLLKYKKPKGGAPLAAGVTAKLIVKLKGDLAATLEAAGFRDATEERTLSQVPFAFLLGEQAYRGTRNLAQKSKVGKKSAGKQTD
jgi:PKD repeat protein